MEDDDLTPAEPKKMPRTQPLARLAQIVQSVEGDGIGTHKFSDIGRYTVFPENHWRRMFPRKAFGTIREDDFSRNETLGLMTREEGLRLTNEFHRLSLPSERNVPWM